MAAHTAIDETSRKLLRRAEVCRALALVIADEAMSEGYLKVAEIYEAVAQTDPRSWRLLDDL
jgi:hypothetical protein